MVKREMEEWGKNLSDADLEHLFPFVGLHSPLPQVVQVFALIVFFPKEKFSDNFLGSNILLNKM